MPPSAGRPGIDGPDLHLESTLWSRGHTRVAGVDEVGRGPLAGPVVAAAVIFPARRPLPESLSGLDDSKKLQRQQRQTLLAAIRGFAVDIALGRADPREIDRLNIRRATLLAMSRAIAALPQPPTHLLIDGRDLPENRPCPALAVIKGDTLSASIAAASIVAKLFRDRLMADLDARHPGYGWARNSGYPTREHRQALKKLGITEHHRRSYAPVRDLLPSEPTG